MNRTSLQLVVVACLTVFANGCAIKPEIRSVDSLPRSDAAPHALSATLAGVTLEELAIERVKRYDHGSIVDPEAVQRQVSLWLQKHGVFASLQEVEETDTSKVLDSAWDANGDVVVKIRLTRFRTSFDGHSKLWGPNLVLWWLIMAPAWFVPTEEYSLSTRVELEIHSVHTGLMIHSKRFPIRVETTLSEISRGWKFLGVFGPRLHADNWKTVARALIPAARAEIAAKVTQHLRHEFTPPVEQTKKTMALAVGVSSYRDESQLPPLPFAAKDAAAVAEALREGVGLSGRHVVVLQDQAATRPNVFLSLKRLRDRTRDGDRVVLYFAGYGTRDDSGEPVLLLNQGRISFSDLAAELQTISGDKLVLVDCGFDGQGRSVKGGAAPADRAADLGILSATGAAIIVAASAGDHLVAPEQAGASLFAFHLVRGLRGGADRQKDGVVTPSELFSLVSKHVVADAAYFGKTQEPAGAGLENSFVLDLRGGTQ